MATNTAANSTDRSLRSVFVGNIPYDATEEKLKDIFSEVGPVISFKLVYDRESGKPKGYGFCEYKDQETALSAMRNLNQYELNGRNLRVDNATNERLKEEMRNLQLSLSGAAFETPYGPEVDPDKAPEAISKAVASLPPEQMYELAKQMKQCIQTNPSEARNMLIQNPQLAYALLQALVVMRVVDPQMAMSILHRPNPNPPQVLMPQPGPQQLIPPPQQPMFDSYPPQQRPVPLPQQMPPQQQPFDNRMHDPRLRDGTPFDRFGPQTGPMNAPIPPQNLDPRTRPIDPRIQGQMTSQNIRGGANSGAPIGMNRGAGGQQFGGSNIQLPPNFGSMAQPGATMTASQEQEKAQLIMQVLALSDQQIAMLPTEQRDSILLLKQQIQRGST
ncbi:cleavage stimulation factor subunit 2-like [Oppia nitens]|uniref:cleavage stimulation factor subunit 2-like n=1 Tax=Oppia nitens TaxID=1686743 RepID=UPI0023DABFB1|nr:cleavage stimulation factor subunit 2-like [Oppia nitens]